MIIEGIVDAIKAVFVPDDEYIETVFNEFTDELKFKFGVDTAVFENLFSSETPVQDITFEYSIPGLGGFKFKAFDASFFADGVSYFRPIIRGFLVLMMFFFHVKQCIGFFGYDAGVVTGRSEHIASEKKAQRE